MPVQRFRSIEEMNAAPILVPAEEGIERFLRHCARIRRLSRRRYRPGVYRFRSVEEMSAARPPVVSDDEDGREGR